MLSSKYFVKIPTSGAGDLRSDSYHNKDLLGPRWTKPEYEHAHRRWLEDHRARETQARAQQVEDDSSAGGIAGGDNSSSVSELARFLTRQRYTKDTVELITRELNITEVWQLQNVSDADLDKVCQHLKIGPSKLLQKERLWARGEFKGQSHAWNGQMPGHHTLRM